MTILINKTTENKRYTMRSIVGDCLEAAGIIIPGGGKAVIDQNAEVRVGDLVHCCRGVGNLSTCLKQVKSIDGDEITVGTAYMDESRDYTFVAGEIYGVVTEAYSDFWGDCLYRREYHESNVVVLPCKEGEHVWVIPTKENGLEEITEMIVNGFMIGKPCNVANCSPVRGTKLYQPAFENFGVTVFFSLSHARYAMKNRRSVSLVNGHIEE